MSDMYQKRIQIPSRGKVGNSHINFRTPNAGELLSYTEFQGNHVYIINELINSITDDDIYNYTVGDRDFIALNIRSALKGDDYNGSFKCDKCGKKITFSLSLSNDIKVYQLPDDFEHPSKFTLPISNKEVQVSLFTVEKELKFEDYMELYRTSDDQKNLKHYDLYEKNALNSFVKYAVMLEEPGGSIDEKITFLRKLDFSDLYYGFIFYESLFKVGPDLSYQTKCDDCDINYKVKIPIDSSFFGVDSEYLLLGLRFLSKSMGIDYKGFKEMSSNQFEWMLSKEMSKNKSSK